MEGEAMFGKLLSKVIINCGSEDEWPGIKAAKTRYDAWFTWIDL